MYLESTICGATTQRPLWKHNCLQRGRQLHFHKPCHCFFPWYLAGTCWVLWDFFVFIFLKGTWFLHHVTPLATGITAMGTLLWSSASHGPLFWWCWWHKTLPHREKSDIGSYHSPQMLNGFSWLYSSTTIETSWMFHPLVHWGLGGEVVVVVVVFVPLKP
jgi:hypothetical protein